MPQRRVSCHLCDAVVPSFFKNLPQKAGTPPGSKPTDVTPLLQIDDGRLLNQLPVWAPDPAIRHKILVDNPARLYGF
jgi:hypothetical protein